MIYDICNQFKYEHPLISNIFHCVHLDDYLVEFSMSTINGSYLRYYIPYRIEPSEEEILKALNTLHAALAKLEGSE